MLGLADVELNILRFSALADDHTGINLGTGLDEEGTAVLGVEQTVGNGLAALKGDQGALFTELDISLIRSIAVEDGVHDTVTLGVGHEFPTVADESAGRNGELQTGVSAVVYAHSLQLTFPESQLLDDVSGELVRNIDVYKLHGLQFFTALVRMVDNLCLTYGKFITLTAHILDEDGQMKLTTAGNLEGLSGLSLFHTETDIRIQLTEQTVS